MEPVTKRPRLDHVKRNIDGWSIKSAPEKMRLEYFPAVIVLQKLGKLFEFNPQTLEKLHKRCYNEPSIAHRMFKQFKKYLEDMATRPEQRIPKEQLQEYFGGSHSNDVRIQGKFSINMKLPYPYLCRKTRFKQEPYL